MNATPPNGRFRVTAEPVDAASAAVGRPQRRGKNPWMRRALLLVASAILLDSLFGDRGLAQTIRARRDYQRAAATLARLKAENAALRDEVRRLTGDPAAIEAVAREDLGLVRPGEILVVVKDLN